MRSSGASGVPPAMYQRMAFELGEVAARRHFKKRNLAVRILGEEFRSVAFALDDVDFDQPIGNAQLRQGEACLVAVAGTLHRVEREHGRFPNSRAALTRDYCGLTASTRRCHGTQLARDITRYDLAGEVPLGPAGILAGAAEKAIVGANSSLRRNIRTNMASIMGTPSGMRLTCAMERATSGTSQTPASKVFCHGAKPRTKPSTARNATAGASTIMS